MSTAPIYLYEVFLLGEREPRCIDAVSLDAARVKAVGKFSNVRHVRLAREDWNNQDVAEGLSEYFAKYPFGNMPVLGAKDSA